VRTSRRYQVRLGLPLQSGLEGFAQEHGLALCPAIRYLVARGLEVEATRLDGGESPAESAAALAALTAAEHAVLMVASVLPEGERRMRSLAERAAEAAEERLALFRRPGADGERP
jgi:hypothetical protein